MYTTDYHQRTELRKKHNLNKNENNASSLKFKHYATRKLFLNEDTPSHPSRK